MTAPPPPESDNAGPMQRDRPFLTEPNSLGRCTLDNLDNVAEVLAAAEGKDFH